MGKEGDLSDYEHGCWCQTGWSISETVDLLGFSQTIREWAENEKKKNPVSGSSE